MLGGKQHKAKGTPGRWKHNQQMWDRIGRGGHTGKRLRGKHGGSLKEGEDAMGRGKLIACVQGIKGLAKNTQKRRRRGARGWVCGGVKQRSRNVRACLGHSLFKPKRATSASNQEKNMTNRRYRRPSEESG